MMQQSVHPALHRMDTMTMACQAAVAAVIVTKKFDEDAAGSPNARHCEPAHLSFSCMLFFLVAYVLR
jgi:hypothetical protein